MHMHIHIHNHVHRHEASDEHTLMNTQVNVQYTQESVQYTEGNVLVVVWARSFPPRNLTFSGASASHQYIYSTTLTLPHSHYRTHTSTLALPHSHYHTPTTTLTLPHSRKLKFIGGKHTQNTRDTPIMQPSKPRSRASTTNFSDALHSSCIQSPSQMQSLCFRFSYKYWCKFVYFAGKQGMKITSRCWKGVDGRCILYEFMSEISRYYSRRGNLCWFFLSLEWLRVDWFFFMCQFWLIFLDTIHVVLANHEGLISFAIW